MRARMAVRSASCFASAAAAPPFFSLASRARRQLGLEPRILTGQAFHDLHERFQPRLDRVERALEGGVSQRLRLAFAPAFRFLHVVLLNLPPARRPPRRLGSARRRRAAASRHALTSSRASERSGEPNRRVNVVFTNPSLTPGPR